MTGEQVILLAFIVAGLLGVGTFGPWRQGIRNFASAIVVAACFAVAVDALIDAWAPTPHSFLISILAFTAAVGVFMQVAVRRDWNNPAKWGGE